MPELTKWLIKMKKSRCKNEALSYNKIWTTSTTVDDKNDYLCQNPVMFWLPKLSKISFKVTTTCNFFWLKLAIKQRECQANVANPSGMPSANARDVSARNWSRDISTARSMSSWKSWDDVVWQPSGSPFPTISLTYK